MRPYGSGMSSLLLKHRYAYLKVAIKNDSVCMKSYLLICIFVMFSGTSQRNGVVVIGKNLYSLRSAVSNGKGP